MANISQFADQCVYLDIETTGLSSVFDSVTIVGVYDGTQVQRYLSKEITSRILLHIYVIIPMMVTFNGAGFDLRFLNSRFPTCRFRRFTSTCGGQPENWE